MVVGEGLLSAARFALRVVACGNALSLTLEPNLSRSFSSFPAWAEYLIADSLESSGTFESDGGGGRITQRCALRPSGRCLRQRSLAGARVEPWSKLLILPRMGRIFNCGFAWEVQGLLKVMVVGEGLLSAARFALRVVACGNALSLALESNLGRSFSSFPAWAEYLIADSLGSSGTFESDGGGGRIRTFEVDDGRFTVCSLWPLGNPTRGNSNFEVMLEMVVGEGLFVASLLTLRAVACGNVLSLSLESNLSRRFSPFPDECKLSQSHRSYHIAVVNYGGGGRIRTFEVDDGRFTVCSLWPLGNPTTG